MGFLYENFQGVEFTSEEALGKWLAIKGSQRVNITGGANPPENRNYRHIEVFIFGDLMKLYKSGYLEKTGKKGRTNTYKLKNSSLAT